MRVFARLRKSKSNDKEKRKEKIHAFIIYLFDEQCLRTVWSYLFCRRLTIKLFTSYPPHTWSGIFILHTSLDVHANFSHKLCQRFFIFLFKGVFLTHTHADVHTQTVHHIIVYKTYFKQKINMKILRKPFGVYTSNNI